MAEATLTRLPTAEEYSLFREAYAETYPVRALMNAIDVKDAELERLQTKPLAVENVRLKAQVNGLRADCARFITANAEVGALNIEQAETIARLRAALVRAEEGLQCGGHRDRDHYCPNCDNSLWPVRKGLQDARDGAVETTKSLGPPDCICPKCGAYIMNPWDEPRVADKTDGGT